MSLSRAEIQRYRRHLLLKEIGGEGQRKLASARVLAVGAGGLGSPVLLYLAAAGVGTLGVIDGDRVSLDNLQRQVIHGTPDVGLAKTASAQAAIRRLNPHVRVEAYEMRFDAGNALGILSQYDIVADGSDNFATRYLVSDACYFARKTLVSAALGPFDGYVTTLKPHETAPDGMPWPTYRCLFPEAPPPGSAPPCSETGILGSVAGVVGTLQATEILKEITGAGESLAGRLILYDALHSRFETVTVPWDPGNPLTGRKPRIRDLSGHIPSPRSAETAPTDRPSAPEKSGESIR